MSTPLRRDRHRTRRGSRRAISSVLSMMFLVLFSSLTAAMAVVAQGNLRTADSYLHVSRAMSAAETGLIFASRRLESESSRFVVEKGFIDQDYGHELWLGTFDPGATGEVVILPPDGYTTSTTPEGLAEAILFAHLADSHSFDFEQADASLPSLDEVTGTLRTKPIRLSDMENTAYFKLKYELLEIDPESEEDVPYIRVTSQGVDGDIRRTLQMDFNITKKIEFAVLSPNRVMIGKNVRIEGPLGTRYGIQAGELDTPNGDPLVMRSDFYYLDTDLDTKLDTLGAQIVLHDVDGDARLRPDHPTESMGIAGYPELVDYNGDEYVDDFDLFLAQYDTSGDGRLELATEFAGVDDQLATLIDHGLADRDVDGDIDSFDNALGYDDGFIDSNDMYGKVHGRLGFAIAREPWDAANGASYQTIVHGPVRPEIDDAPVTFEVTEEDMREITTEMVSNAQAWLDSESASGDDFASQVAAGGGTYTPPDPNNADDWESVPYNAIGAYDFYNRGVYEDMTFENVRIPMGNNGLFVNCTFKGVTYIEAEPNCQDVNWNYAGGKKPNEADPAVPPFIDKYPGLVATLAGVDVPDTRVYSNNIRFHDCTFIGSVSGDAIFEYTHWRNKIQFTGNTRFYIDENEPELNDSSHPDYQPDADEILSDIASLDDTDIEELEKSSILMPGWSVDVGSFTNELGSKVKLKGTIISGIFDVRGTVDVYGTLLMTFRPVDALGPLFYGGQTDAFNTTIGYFGPSDGDGEGVDPASANFTGFGEITLRYNPDGKLPDGIPWPIKMEPQPLTYIEGGSL
jgi:hypothetical protein